MRLSTAHAIPLSAVPLYAFNVDPAWQPCREVAPGRYPPGSAQHPRARTSQQRLASVEIVNGQRGLSRPAWRQRFPAASDDERIAHGSQLKAVRHGEADVRWRSRHAAQRARGLVQIRGVRPGVGPQGSHGYASAAGAPPYSAAGSAAYAVVSARRNRGRQRLP
jgi:hypothetical protein